MAYDDRSVKPMSASLMRARIATRIVAGIYETVPTLLTSAVRLQVELPGGAAHEGPPYPFTFAVSPAWCSGVAGARLVGSRKLDIAWLNPAVIASMAYLGKGPFRRPLPLRALAVFPSWDRLVVAVAGSLGIRSMDELKEKRPALRVSVADNDCVNFAIRALLKAHGLTLESFTAWGGAVEPVARPSNPRRREGIISGEIHMVIDEGLDSWGQLALEHGMLFLPFSQSALAKLEKYGFRRAPLGGGRLRGDFDPKTEVIDYSGWPIVTHAGLADELAYHFVSALDRIREEIPYDCERVPAPSSLCASTEEGPLDIPLHPGAERCYREKGYLS
ncbi:MAG TPA: TAXI family TRAP transporter solute-binding subunit [Candidatus Acidoferrales bacterium]|nr:TAXI family TRAP transporter solute-binding subunit [Candidatus Acidoferrales bacterium]